MKAELSNHMKKLTWFCITAMTLSSFIACGVRKKDMPLEAKLRMKNKTAQVCIPGKAGSITVGGILLQTVDNAQQPVDKLEIKKYTGAKFDQELGSLAANIYEVELQLSTSAKENLEKISKDKTYYNFNCEASDLEGDVVNNWTELPLVNIQKQSSYSLVANSIYICGSTSINATAVSLVADKVVLKKMARFALADVEAGLLVIQTNSIITDSPSTLGGFTKKANTQSQSGVGLSVFAAKELVGSSKLTLVTQGRDCLTPDSTADEKTLEKPTLRQQGEPSLDGSVLTEPSEEEQRLFENDQQGAERSRIG